MSWAVTATGGAAVPIYLGYRWWRRHQREQELARELDEANSDVLQIPEHLSPALAALARETHRLRLELETPVRRVRAPLISETPWARRQRCDEYDSALYEVRRAIWDWLRTLRRLEPKDQLLLGELGLSVAPFRRVLFGCDRTTDVWEQVVFAQAPDLDLIWAELRRAILELRRFERALLSASIDPYR
ncbi:hypothetical protein ENSA5_43760 [Enhygromyxa salina]|uniref:Uncharacterized protein n=1 Tax=Enhygromyxa salina TaxID=215803 RepID=A0A2S9XKS6_9BACT|nr:hypothetical protein [Enhygromyxa salina]PRP93281.1 hypothetical protein ENSA5_43760 [Enhygromyxa salina]